MPLDVRICLKRDFLLSISTGSVTFDDILAGMDDYLNDCNYRPGRPELIDLSGVTETDLNFKLMSSLVREVNDQVPGIKLTTKTVVCAPPGTLFGLARMYETLAELAGGIEVFTYDTEAAALEKMGLPYSTFEALCAAEEFKPVSRQKEQPSRTG
ncbi:hypothetical protein [Gymnodinialimonas sp. 57CJ19]|uniref:hypothetical protein n=1 Tax=Gymnodinialimonas sp. 57CJ19 TaxID=3138498 RepID=UPI00313429CE